MATKVFWSGNLEEGLRRFDVVMHARLEALAHFVAEDMERSAKLHAPWKDQTSNARNGLKGTPIMVPGKEYGAILSHGVPYGIWLEVRWAGKYAIVRPTIARESIKVGAMVKSLMRGL